MTNDIKVTTIPATGYYSCGTYTDSNGNTFSHLQWYGEELPDNYDGSGNLWFFKEGEEELAGTIIIYDPENSFRKQLAEKEMEYFEETYLDIEDEQVFDRIEDSSEQEAYTSLRDALMDDMKEFDRYDFGFPVQGELDLPENEDKKFEPEPSAIEPGVLEVVRERLFKLYNNVDEDPEYNDYAFGLWAAVEEIDKMITENHGKYENI